MGTGLLPSVGRHDISNAVKNYLGKFGASPPCSGCIRNNHGSSPDRLTPDASSRFVRLPCLGRPFAASLSFHGHPFGQCSHPAAVAPRAEAVARCAQYHPRNGLAAAGLALGSLAFRLDRPARQPSRRSRRPAFLVAEGLRWKPIDVVGSSDCACAKRRQRRPLQRSSRQIPPPREESCSIVQPYAHRAARSPAARQEQRQAVTASRPIGCSQHHVLSRRRRGRSKPAIKKERTNVWTPQGPHRPRPLRPGRLSFQQMWAGRE